MPVADVDVSHEDFQDAGLPPAAGPTSRTLVRFFYRPFQVIEKVKQEDGAEVDQFVWKKREMVEIRAPGDRFNAPTKIVTAAIRQQYAHAYRAWKAGEDQTTAGGWPLTKWPEIDVAQLETLKAHKCYTVEHFAAMSDDNLGRMGPGWKTLRQAARDFLAAAKSAAPLAALREDNNKLRAQAEAQQQTIEALKQAVEKLQAKAGKRDAKDDAKAVA
jgi:hypothetical protein